jgi:hypothetical protein
MTCRGETLSGRDATIRRWRALSEQPKQFSGVGRDAPFIGTSSGRLQRMAGLMPAIFVYDSGVAVALAPPPDRSA